MLLTQKWIMRSDLKNNPHVLYLFGDNLRRVGMGGQAKEMRHEPNACGVATKKEPTSGANVFFTDDEYEENVRNFMIDLRPAFDHARSGGIVIVPEDGLGTGLSEMPQRAPKSLAALNALIQSLDPNFVTKEGMSGIRIEGYEF